MCKATLQLTLAPSSGHHYSSFDVYGPFKSCLSSKQRANWEMSVTNLHTCT